LLTHSLLLPMTTIISATNRPDSMTLKIAKLYQQIFMEQGADVQLVSLEGKAVWERSADMHQLEKEFLIPSQKFVFIMPEYNGSFPGIVKTMLDNSDIRNCWWGKKVMLTGVAAGRAGNLRGMEHMTNIMHYLRMHVFYNKLPISNIQEEIDQEGNLLQAATRTVIEQQIEEFILF